MIKNNKPEKTNQIKVKNDGYKRKRDISSVQKNRNIAYIKRPENTELIDSDMPENKYYSNIAYKIKLAKWFLIAFLVLFIFGGMALNSKELNADNLSYLLRYLNIQGSNKSVKSDFYIELDEASSVCYYKNNIAVLRKNRLDIYDMNGKRNFTSKLVYSNPVLKTSDKYIIAYDLGMNKLEIFNSFSRVYEYKGDSPVYYAQITDRGNIVYVTDEKGYNSAVYVMNNGFDVTFRCMFEKDYIICADIDDKAERLAVAGFFAQDGDYLSRVILYETHSEQPVRKIEIPGEQPYSIKLNETGIFAVFENSLRFYNQNGDEILNYNFTYRKIEAISLTSKLAAVVLNEKTLGTDNKILIFDGNSNVLYDNIINAEIIDMKFSEDYKFLYFLTRTGLYKINIEQKTFEFVTSEYDETTNSIVYANDTNIFLSGLLKINAVDAE